MSLLTKNVAAISAAVIGVGAFASHVSAGTYQNIMIDGTFTDWTNVPVAATAPGGNASPDLVQLKVANNSTYVFFELTYDTAVVPTSGGGTYIGIDSDNNPATGYAIYGSTLIGSNAAYQNDFPFTQAAGVFNNGGTLTDAGLSSAPAYFSGVSTVNEELAIPIDASQTDANAGGYSGPLFQTPTNSFTVEFYTGSSVLGPYLYTIAAPPVVSAYALSGSGDFNVAGNWSNGVPNAPDAEADFTSSITANHTVYSDTTITLGKIVFNNTFTYVLAGAGNLILQASSGSALVDAQAGTQKITLPITVASNTVFQAESGATLVIGAPVEVQSGQTLTQSGAGSVVYQSTITVDDGGTISLAATSHAALLSLLGASNASLIAETGTVKTALQLDSLSIAAGSTLNLHNGDLIVHNGSLSSVTSSVQSGFAAGSAAWSGTGITSSAAAADSTHLTAVGVIQNISGGNAIYTSFDNVGVHSGDVLVKYTYYGDSNLDGAVDGSDYTLIDNGFSNHLSGWYNGDYNYDGVVDGSDYTLIDNAFNTQGASLGTNPLALVASDTAQIAGGSSAVPEPTTLGLLGIGAAGLMARRRRGHGQGQ